MKNIFNKIILAIFILLFSNVKDQEILEEWEDNTQDKIEPTISDSSYLLSYAIDNITNSKLYLGDKNLYLIDDLENTAISIKNNNIKSISSPLIKLDSIYYFCSSPYIYIIDDKKIKKNIDISKQIKYSGEIKSMKCAYYHNEEQDYIIVSLIGANYILIYNTTENKIINNFKLLGNLIDINFYGIDTIDPVFSAIVKNDNNLYIYQMFQFNNKFIDMLNSNLNEYKDFEFYDESNIAISFISNKIILILNYIPYKKFNFYHYDIETKKLELVGGKNLFPFFNEYSIINANFIENTPIIYYKITKNGRYYIGAADLKYFIILYNIEIFYENNILYDDGYFYQSEGFLNYFENNTKKQICPFVLYSNKCLFYLKDKYFVISKTYSSNGLYKNYFSDSCLNGQKLGNYCLEKCPIGSSLTGKGSCFQCTYNVFFNLAEKKCIEVCDYNKDNKICYDCEQNNKIYYNNSCIDNCTDVNKIYDINEKKCVKCDGYFDKFKKKCIEKCSPSDEIDEENKVCINCKAFNMYSLVNSNKTRCYKKCPLYYIQNEDSFQCEQCNPDLFFKNGQCVQNCGETGLESSTKINGINVKYCLSCKDIQKYEYNKKCYNNCNELNSNLYNENGVCKAMCSEGYELNNNQCESCLEKGLFYYGKKCIDKCPQNYAWDELDNICKQCDENLFLEDNRCVETCKDTSKKTGNVCITCPDFIKFYSSGACVASCPKYSLINKLTNYCSFCSDDNNYFNSKCITDCKEPYVTKKIDYHNVCDFCEEGKWFISRQCKDACESNSYGLNEDNSCHPCFCHSRGICKNNITNECECNNQESNNYYFGQNCEFIRKSNIEKDLEIIPLNNKTIKSDISFYKFIFKKNVEIKKIKWEFFLGRDEITSNSQYKNYFITGYNEEIFGINPNLYSEIYYNYIHLTLTTNEKDFEDEIIISVKKLDITSEYNVDFSDVKLQDSGYLYKPMNTTIDIEQTQYNNMNSFKFYYKFYFVNENDEEIPLTGYQNNRSIKTYYIPFAKKYFVNIKDDRGEITKYEIKNENSKIYKRYNDYGFYSKSIKDIFDDINYNIIEKIFIFMIVFNSEKRIVDKDNLKILFNYIDSNYRLFINTNGFYNIEERDKMHIINYSEPKVLFILINYIIISQKTNINKDKITIILDSLKKCVELIDNQYGEYKIKLSSNDIKSLLRTIEQLHDVYNENKNKIDDSEILSDFYYLYDKINNYLSSKLYPGEGIKIIGNRTILFSYNFGHYQELLAISSNNLTSPANISNISTFSYEDYQLSEKTCDSNGGTFLCINKTILDNIKNKLKVIGYQDIKNISLNIYIVNNINNNEKDGTNENDNYLVRFQFFDLNERANIQKILIDEKLFYSLEFSYINEKRKMTSNQAYNNDKENIFYMPYNYSNVICYPKNYRKNEKYYCFTYFDYKTDIIQCKCNIIDEIAIIENEELANYYKSLQFNSIQFTYTNIVTKYFIIIFLCILLIPGLIFLLFDICKINKHISNYNNINFKARRRELYNEVKKYTNSTFTFPIYSTFIKFPYFSVFNSYHYSSPTFLKHLIVITALLLGFTFNLIHFYFYLPFEEKQILLDKRDITIDNEEIHSIRIINKYLYRSLFFSLINLIFVHYFIKLFNKLLKYDEKNLNHWRNIKAIFKDFIYFEVKKKRYLGKNFSRIKNRMKALYALCGRYMLNKNIMNHPERNKKLENYIKYTGKLNKNTTLLLTNNKIKIKDNNKKNDNLIGTDKESLVYELPENYSFYNNDDSSLNNNEYKPPIINTKSKVAYNINSVISSFGNNNNLKMENILKKLKMKKSDNFQINGRNDNQYNLTKNTICRLEKIKNKYMDLNKCEEIDISKRKINKEKEYSLSIYYNINISIFNFENYKSCNNNDIFGDVKKDIKRFVLTTIALGFIFFFLLFLSFILIKKLMNEYEYFMVKIWILSTFLVLLITYFLIYFIGIIIGSILLFYFYNRRNKGCFTKLMFRIFVDKILIYIYKSRNYITKYRREFINI